MSVLFWYKLLYFTIVYNKTNLSLFIINHSFFIEWMVVFWLLNANKSEIWQKTKSGYNNFCLFRIYSDYGSIGIRSQNNE